MSALTTRQKTELTTAVADYLDNQGPAMKMSSSSFRREAGLPASGAVPTSPTTKAALEKKWVMSAMLAVNITELEDKVAMLEAIEKRNDEVAVAQKAGGVDK